MDHSPPDPAVSDPALSDPLFTALRQHHPDVDVVLLPPEPVAPPDLPVAKQGECRTLQAHARAVVEMLGEHLDVAPEAVVSFWWRQAHPLVHRWVVRAWLGAGDGDARGLLRRTGQRLADLGWDARPAADGSPRLRAVTAQLEVVAAAQDDAVSLQVITRALHVPQDLMAALLGDVEHGRE